MVNLQLDVFSAASMDNDGDGAENYYGGSGLGVHLNYRDAQGALGVFGTGTLWPDLIVAVSMAVAKAAAAVANEADQLLQSHGLPRFAELVRKLGLDVALFTSSNGGRPR